MYKRKANVNQCKPFRFGCRSFQISYTSLFINHLCNSCLWYKFTVSFYPPYMLKKGIQVFNAELIILGFTFKENCPDVRNTKVIDIYRALREFNVNVTVYDPWANPAIAKREYGIEVVNELPTTKFDAAIATVAHKKFENLDVLSLLNEKHVIFDVKCTLPRDIVDARL